MITITTMEAFVASKRDAKQKEELVPLSEVVDPSVGQGRQQSETLRLVFCAVCDWLGRFAPVGLGSGFFFPLWGFQAGPSGAPPGWGGGRF